MTFTREQVILIDLSDRARTIIQLISDGLTTKQIALRLSVSPRTVDCYKTKLSQRLGLKHIADVTRFAVKSGLASLCLMIFCGCATGAASDPPTPMFVNNSAPVLDPAPKLQRDFYLPLEYPPDMTNYTWSLEESLDATNWDTLAIFPKGVLPSNYNYTVHMGTNQVKFWRMRGVRD